MGDLANQHISKLTHHLQHFTPLALRCIFCNVVFLQGLPVEGGLEKYSSDVTGEAITLFRSRFQDDVLNGDAVWCDSMFCCNRNLQTKMKKYQH